MARFRHWDVNVDRDGVTKAVGARIIFIAFLAALGSVPTLVAAIGLEPVHVVAVRTDSLAIGIAGAVLGGAAVAIGCFAQLVGRYAKAARGWKDESELNRYPPEEVLYDAEADRRSYVRAKKELADAIGMTPGVDPVVYVEALEMAVDAARDVSEDRDAQAPDRLASALQRVDDVQEAARPVALVAHG